MELKNGRLGRCLKLENGAIMTRIFHPSYKKGREKGEDIEEIFSLTQRFSRCIYQENCLNWAIFLHWSGFSCLRCPLKDQPAYAAQLEDLKGVIPLEW